jgi:hypothetical protein
MPRSVEVITLILWVVVVLLLGGILSASSAPVHYELAYGRISKLGDGAYVVGDGLVLSPPKDTRSYHRLGELKGRVVTIRVEVER